MKLWNKSNTTTAAQVEQFTVGRDKEFDLLLAEYDILGSIAHTQMLAETGLINASERSLLHRELNALLQDVRAGNFVIEASVEDVHSQVEWMLTQRIGDAGKKIHSGRSRNDQVAVDIKLFLRAEILHIKAAVQELFDLLIEKSELNKDILLPGYTHFQAAMPSSFGLWFGAYAESLIDDMELLSAAYRVVNKNPLGSGAGYGSSLPINRQTTTELLGFASMNYNVVYAQMSRGKTEKTVAIGLGGIAATLAKLSMDICLYNSQDLGFISLPAAFTTGSSMMPHKKNPDVFELIRARCNRIQAVPNELNLLLGNLPSGYHRDLQLTKEILFPAIGSLKDCISMACLMLESMEVKADILQQSKYKYLFTVEQVNELVQQGIPFREAYIQVGDAVEKGVFEFDTSKALQHSHEGSIGHLCNPKIKAAMEKVMAGF
jgi:argininosuccinate lyase